MWCDPYRSYYRQNPSCIVQHWTFTKDSISEGEIQTSSKEEVF